MINNKMMIDKTGEKEYLFVAATHYHILYTLVLIEWLDIKENSILLLRYVPDYIHNIAEQLKKEGYNVINWGNPFPKTFLGRIKYFGSSKKDRECLEELRKRNPKKEIVLINFAWNVKHIYFGAKIYFELCDLAYFIEEGPNCFSNYTGNPIELLIKKIVGDNFNYYNEKKLKRIFVTLPERYPVILQPKLEKLRLFDLWNGIASSSKMRVLAFFISKELYSKIFSLSSVGIVFTQPLSEDGYISEKRKIRIYAEICDYYGKYGTILLKPHPRDTSNYNLPGVEIIDRLWPSEILTFTGVKFEFAVGICTSAVINSDAKIKLNLNDNYLTDKMLEMIPIEMNVQ